MEEINIKELLDFFISKIFLIIIIVLVFAANGYLYFAHIQTPKYHSSTTIILVSEQEDTNTSNISLNQQLVSTYSEIIKNSSVLNKVINKLDLNMTVKELANNISVTSVDKTEIIKIEVSSIDNVLARDIASEITKTFITEVNDIFKLQNVTILSEAGIEKQPYNVSLVKQVTLSSIVGLFISLIILFALFYFDTSIKSVEAIENKAKLTVLGTVEKVKGKNEEK
ncbi:MAG: hypothetical protein HFH45_02075 [Bacilli bacterium]|nr:hypothetical protein [Bacilli bacterium]